eukprot:s2950_g9.t1
MDDDSCTWCTLEMCIKLVTCQTAGRDKLVHVPENRNVSDVEFLQALKEFGYEQRDKHLFHALDRHGKKKINLEDRAKTSRL